MKIIVTYKELENVSNNVKENSHLIDDQLDKMTLLVNDMKKNWQGDAADIFYNSIDFFLNIDICTLKFKNIITYDT